MKSFDAIKQHAFIEPDGGGTDLFDRVSAVKKAGYTGVAEGAEIGYELVNAAGKTAEENLRVG